MAELFLLGAGASVDAGIPGAYRMTQEMLKKFERTNYPQTEKVIRFVVGGLLFHQGIRGMDPFDGVNIEDLFNAVSLLGDRRSSEIGPFISSWHPQLERLASGELAPFTSRELLESIYKPIEDYLGTLQESGGTFIARNKIKSSFATSQFESQLKNAVEQITIGGEEKLFQETAKIMIYNLVEMVLITEPEKISYIIPLVEYAQKTNSTIATLNYDNAIELAGQVAGIDVETGIDSWSSSGEINSTDGKVQLIKLHGSIDWKLSDGRTSKEKPLPFQIIEKIDLKQKSGWITPTVVFGGKNKLTAKGPFLSLLRSFEQKLARVDLLTIIGYSLRDEHINEFIATWFNEDVNRKIRIVDLYPEKLEHDFAKKLLRGHSKDRVVVIKETATNGIASLTKLK